MPNSALTKALAFNLAPPATGAKVPGFSDELLGSTAELDALKAASDARGLAGISARQRP